MITPDGVVRVTVTLEPTDVDLLDRLAACVGSNRSAELRSMLLQLRPLLVQAVATLEAAQRSRTDFEAAIAAAGLPEDLEVLLPEVERLQAAVLGSLARLEGAATAKASQPGDPRPSNHGGHTPPKDQS